MLMAIRIFLFCQTVAYYVCFVFLVCNRGGRRGLLMISHAVVTGRCLRLIILCEKGAFERSYSIQLLHLSNGVYGSAKALGGGRMPRSARNRSGTSKGCMAEGKVT